MRSWMHAGVCSMMLACGEPEEATTGSASSGTGDTTGTTTDDPTQATTTDPTMPGESSSVDGSSTTATADSGTSTTGPDVELQHGFVRVQLQRAADRAEDPFIGTERIQITLNYEQCIFDFYAANPQWAPDGDEGESVFGSLALGGEGWFDRLCEVGVPDQVDCEVASIEQQLEPIPVLRINYIVTGELDGRVVPFGPLPTLALAGCSGEVLPTVRLSNGNLVVGYIGVDEIWDGADYAPNIVATDDETPIVVDVTRTN